MGRWPDGIVLAALPALGMVLCIWDCRQLTFTKTLILFLLMMNFGDEFWVFFMKQLVVLLHFPDFIHIPVIHVLIVQGEDVPHSVPEDGVHSCKILVRQNSHCDWRLLGYLGIKNLNQDW